MSRNDVLDYINSFGKFPLLTQNWTEADLNFTKIFNEIKLEFIINMKVNFCPHPVTRDDIVCLTHVQQFGWERYKRTSSNYTIKDIKDMLEILKISSEGVEEIVDGLFRTSLDYPYQVSGQEQVVTSINELKANSSSFNINWLEVINSQLPEWLKRNSEDQVFVLRRNLIYNRLSFLETVDKR